LLVQTGEVDHPLARYLPLDQVNRDAFLLGADHSDDSCRHCISPFFLFGPNETRNEEGKQAAHCIPALRTRVETSREAGIGLASACSGCNGYG
jgi:hypothetical protein